MSAQSLRALSRHKDLIGEFRRDPRGTAQKLESLIGRSLPRLKDSDVEVIQTMTDEELETIVNIAERAERSGGVISL
jgi:hypothetical protein